MNVSTKKSQSERLRKVDVPEGKSGDWEVSRFTVTEEDIKLHNLRAVMRPGCRTMDAGIFTKLTNGVALVMSDTRAELQDHREPARRARDDRDDPKYPNHVLINGLGIGVVLQAVLDEPTVNHATVVEKSEDVIRLVGSHYLQRYGHRLTIINADALEWKPPVGIRYRVVWHDIWNYICADNLPEMHKLHRKYGRRCDWQGSWCRYLCENGR